MSHIKKIIPILGIVMVLFILWGCTTSTETLTIHFETNGGNQIESIEINGTNTLTMPEDPIKEGYRFDGWYMDNDQFNELFSPVMFLNQSSRESVTVYAKWTRIDENTPTEPIPSEPVPSDMFVVSFDSMGGTDVDDQIVSDKEMLIKPHTSKEGHELEGWYVSFNQGDTFDEKWDFSSDTVSESVTLYAKWRVLQFTISFDQASIGQYISDQTYDFGEDIELPSLNPRATLDFMGWYLDPNFQTRFEDQYMPAKDVTLYAKWASKHITITFITNGGSPVDQISGVPGTAITPPDEPIKEGYIFDGWYENNTFTKAWESPTEIPNNDVILYAKWISVLDLIYTVTFETNSDIYLEPVTLMIGQKVLPPTIIDREGYTFGGWYKDEALTDMYLFDDEPQGDLTLYAKWEALPSNLLKITFETNGGTPIDDLLYEMGTDVLIPTHTYKEGHVFEGWFLRPDLTVRVTSVYFSVDVTLYAKWTPKDFIRIITFESNGGSYVYPIHNQQAATIKKPEDPVKPGYTFGGWYKDEAFTQPFVFFNMPFEDTTLYAKWIEQNNSGEVIISSLRDALEAYEFTCILNTCTLEISTGFNYIVTLDDIQFIYEKKTEDVSNEGYRYFESVITIDTNWDVIYTYDVDENYGFAIKTILNLEGNVIDNTYTVTTFESNVTSEASRKEAAIQSITSFKMLIESILDAAGLDMSNLN